MTDLITRLEALDGPDREVDAEIEARRLGKKKAYPADFEHAPRYTASIDAALTLVPEGWHWNVSGPDPIDGNHHPASTLCIDKGSYAILVGPWNNAPEPWNQERVSQEATSATPAVALCIAALKAREHD